MNKKSHVLNNGIPSTRDLGFIYPAHFALRTPSIRR